MTSHGARICTLFETPHLYTVLEPKAKVSFTVLSLKSVFLSVPRCVPVSTHAHSLSWVDIHGNHSLQYFEYKVLYLPNLRRELSSVSPTKAINLAVRPFSDLLLAHITAALWLGLTPTSRLSVYFNVLTFIRLCDKVQPPALILDEGQFVY